MTVSSMHGVELAYTARQENSIFLQVPNFENLWPATKLGCITWVSTAELVLIVS